MITRRRSQGCRRKSRFKLIFVSARRAQTPNKRGLTRNHRRMKYDPDPRHAEHNQTSKRGHNNRTSKGPSARHANLHQTHGRGSSVKTGAKVLRKMETGDYQKKEKRRNNKETLLHQQKKRKQTENRREQRERGTRRQNKQSPKQPRRPAAISKTLYTSRGRNPVACQIQFRSPNCPCSSSRLSALYASLFPSLPHGVLSPTLSLSLSFSISLPPSLAPTAQLAEAGEDEPRAHDEPRCK